jgi:hypothetical protein
VVKGWTSLTRDKLQDTSLKYFQLEFLVSYSSFILFLSDSLLNLSICPSSIHFTFKMGSIEEPVVNDIALQMHIPESSQTYAAARTNKLFSLANRTIAITGGGRGLGITLALAIVEAGGHAACIDILPSPSPSEWASLQKLANIFKISVSYHTCDITNEEEISATLDAIADAGSKAGAPLHGTIACAGIQQKVPAVNYPVDGFRRIMDVNVTGTFLTIKHTSRILIKEGTKGSLVLIASMSGQVANRV